MIILRANSMTFRIEPEKWQFMTNRRFKDELEEYLRWFSSNVSGMSDTDAAKGWTLIRQLKEQLEARGLDTAEYMYLDSVADGDKQISFFSARP